MGRESALEQKLGHKKYRSMVDKSSKSYDDGKHEFTFLPKSKIKCSSSKVFECPNCGEYLTGTKHTYMIECRNCKSLVKVGGANE
jgi:hypothetical protein